MLHKRFARGLSHSSRRHHSGFHKPHHHSSHSCSHSSSSLAPAALGIAALFVASAIKKQKENPTAKEEVPNQKTISGATNMYVPIIQRDFPDFHNPNAESDVQAVMRDYIYCIHTGNRNFNNGSVNKNVLNRIIPKEKGEVSDFIFHQIQIYNYQRTMDYATITYRLSFGYKLNGKTIETRYEVHYTLQLRDHGTSSKAFKCKNCNAPLSTTNVLSTCPYCETRIIRDTIMAWYVSDIREMQ